jgi:hypothetical protein
MIIRKYCRLDLEMPFPLHSFILSDNKSIVVLSHNLVLLYQS